mmetsp:Transcript_46037/g.115474  ORF Transcript_46037/g.115474 Transcript_46037/m.115474 type:complete len:233 (-) Transcript_46037:1087-1785(-)
MCEVEQLVEEGAVKLPYGKHRVSAEVGKLPRSHMAEGGDGSLGGYEGGGLPCRLVLLESNLLAIGRDPLGGRGRHLGARDGSGSVGDPRSGGPLRGGGPNAEGLDPRGKGGGGGGGLGVFFERSAARGRDADRGGDRGGGSCASLLPHAGVGVDLAVQEHELAPQDDPGDAARHLAARERCPSTLGVAVRWEGPLAVEVDLEVRVGLLLEVEDLDGVGVHPQHNVINRQPAL